MGELRARPEPSPDEPDGLRVFARALAARSPRARRAPHEATPAESKGLCLDAHAAYAGRALALAARVPRVKLFVWFTFRDDRTNAWQSGLLDSRGHRRPVYERFAAEVRAIDG